MNKKVILIGGGGHAKVLMETLNRLGVGVNFLVAPEVDHTSLGSNKVIHVAKPYLAKDFK